MNHTPAHETQLGITVCGKAAPDLDRQLVARRAARLASGKLQEDTVRDIEETTFRPVPEGSELDDDSVERLRRLCQLWDVTLRPHAISSHRPVIGPVIVFFKRILLRAMQFLLKDTLHQQRSFNAEVIRALSEMSASREPTKY